MTRSSSLPLRRGPLGRRTDGLASHAGHVPKPDPEIALGPGGAALALQFHLIVLGPRPYVRETLEPPCGGTNVP
jgi:hypothetical protein